MFNLPAGVGVSILSLRDGVKIDEVITENVVLLVRDKEDSKLVSI